MENSSASPKTAPAPPHGSARGRIALIGLALTVMFAGLAWPFAWSGSESISIRTR
jgi:hypothetical protein